VTRPHQSGPTHRWASLASRASQRQALRRELAGELTGFWLDEWSRAGSTESVISSNLRLTRLPLLLQKLILLKALLQRKEMLSPPVPFQGLGDRRLIVFASPIAVAGQTLGIALACENGVDNLHPRLS